MTQISYEATKSILLQELQPFLASDSPQLDTNFSGPTRLSTPTQLTMEIRKGQTAFFYIL